MRHALAGAAVPVNSMHHQGIKALATGAVALGDRAGWPHRGGGVDRADRFIVGVQWHPEVFELSEPSSGVLFTDFVQAASRG